MSVLSTVSSLASFKSMVPTLVCAVALCGSTANRTCMAQDTASRAALESAARFLDSRATAVYVLSFAHMSAKLTDHSYVGRVNVKDSSGRTLPGEFALVYDYEWNSSGYGRTRFAFLCDRDGKVEDVRVLSCTAVIEQPYAIANLSIGIVGAVLLEAFKSQMSDSEQQQIQQLIRSSDSEGMLKIGLRLRQTVGLR